MDEFALWFEEKRISAGFVRQQDLADSARVGLKTISDIVNGNGAKTIPAIREVLANRLRVSLIEFETRFTGRNWISEENSELYLKFAALGLLASPMDAEIAARAIKWLLDPKAGDDRRDALSKLEPEEKDAMLVLLNPKVLPSHTPAKSKKVAGQQDDKDQDDRRRRGGA